jgi:hypothetical protein
MPTSCKQSSPERGNFPGLGSYNRFVDLILDAIVREADGVELKLFIAQDFDPGDI